ncbi:MAG: ATPase [Phycisphaerae bacterium]|nr:MAG: ATPase [Phycisphaerae bacterium]
MQERKAIFDLGVLLPDVPDERDACAARLTSLLNADKGLLRTHVVAVEGKSPARFCVHFDADAVPLAQVERIVRAAGAEVSDQFGHATLGLLAIEAEDGARRIENELLGVPGVLAASVNLAAQIARVEFDKSKTDAHAVRHALIDLGYAEPHKHEQRHKAGHADDDGHDHGGSCCGAPRAPRTGGWLSRNRELVWSLTAGGLLAVAFIGQTWLGFHSSAVVAICVAAYGFGAYDLVSHQWKGWRRGRFTFDIDLLMLLAAVGAAVLGEWIEGAFLLFLFSLAHALEHYAMDRARGAIRALSELAPAKASVIRDGVEREMPIEQVNVGDVVIIRPGERVSVDGTVRSGRSSVNQAPVTGESVPVDKAEGDVLFAGTVNGDGALEVTTTKAVGDRTLDRVIKLVEEAQTQKAPTQQFTERFERIFVPLVLVTCVLLIVVPPLVGWLSWSASFYRGMALLVGASPCALAIGTPSAVLSGIAQAARNGVLIKGGMHLENLGSIRALALDKTGTLTEGKPEVTDLRPADGVDSPTLLAVTAAVERRSQHPLAQAIVRRAETEKLALPEAGELQSLTARGVRSTVGGEPVEVGNLRLWEQDGIAVPSAIAAAVKELKSAGRSVMTVRQGDRWLGSIGVADRPRSNAAASVQRLHALGVRPLIMLTGDNKGVGEAVGRAVGVDEVRADLLPEDKLTLIRELTKAHGSVGMVGDGVNDAPALANATVGIAMGGAGTAVALETADVALMGDDLSKLGYAIDLARRARSTIRQNLFISVAVIALLIFATITGWMRIGPAVLLHEGSTLVVIANSLRLLLVRDRSI